MPVPQKKPITSKSLVSTPESSSPMLPEQEEFRQHVRRLAVTAVQVLIEQAMREELEQCKGKKGSAFHCKQEMRSVQTFSLILLETLSKRQMN